MECTVLPASGKNLVDLVSDFKSKALAGKRSGDLLLTSETGDKTGTYRHLTLAHSPRKGAAYAANAALFIATLALNLLGGHSHYHGGEDVPPYVAAVTFEHEGRDTCTVTISVTGGDTNYPDTDAELKVVDLVVRHIRAVNRSVETIYNSAWIYHEDERVREKAISGLGQVADEMAVEPLTNLLRHDNSDAIREKAALPLRRIGTPEAAEALQRAVNNYINGDRSRHSVAVACAESLGAIRHKKSLESLQELLQIFEKKQLTAQAIAVKGAIYRIEHGKDLKVTICAVCNQPIDENSKLLQCPACKRVAHREHMLEWLHVKDYCPACRRHLDVQSLVKPHSIH